MTPLPTMLDHVNVSKGELLYAAIHKDHGFGRGKGMECEKMSTYLVISRGNYLIDPEMLFFYRHDKMLSIVLESVYTCI